MNGFSLFERWEVHHRHIENDADAMNELFALFEKARKLYHEDVVNGRKSYMRFVEDFYHGHRYIPCDNYLCKNVHEVNIHVVYQLLANRQDLSVPILNAAIFSFEDCVRLKAVFDRPDCNPPKVFPMKGHPLKNPPSTLGRYLTREQVMRITAIATANYLFSFYGHPQDEISSFLECKENFHLIVNNIRNVAVMLDTLCGMELIGRGWQTAIGQRRLLHSKNGRPISASSLSSALSEIKKNPTAESEAIRIAIKRELAQEER